MKKQGGRARFLFKFATPPCKWRIFGRNSDSKKLVDEKSGTIMLMKGITIEFTHREASGTDAFNNPTYTETQVEVEDCLVAPITEPATAREQQAMEQSRDQVRVHFPKTFTDSLAHASFVWGGKTFVLDSDSVPFMNENTPTRWNRYVRAESVNA